jgi:hypothetical protein
MRRGADDNRVHIRLMNEYGGGLPLWPDDPDFDTDELEISNQLRSDLLAFSDRWNESVDPEVTDDRWDGVAVMQQLVRVRYALDRLAHPARQRARAAEYKEMRRIGEALRARLEAELGPTYRVTYLHG